jgi:hypothetical protein
MTSNRFEGSTSEMRKNVKPTPWLASEDILSYVPLTVTIESCFFERGATFDAGRKEDVYTISFKGAKKKLVLNATNRKKLVSMFGTNVKEWFGKAVVLEVHQVRGVGGGMVNGIRITGEGVAKSRLAPPAPVESPTDPPDDEPPPELPSRTLLIDEINAGLSEDHARRQIAKMEANRDHYGPDDCKAIQAAFDRKYPPLNLKG